MNHHRVGKPWTPTKHHGLQIAAFDQLLPGLANIQPHYPLPGQGNLASSAGHLSSFSGHLLLPLGYLNPPLPLLCPAIFLNHKFEQHLPGVYAFFGFTSPLSHQPQGWSGPAISLSRYPFCLSLFGINQRVGANSGTSHGINTTTILSTTGSNQYWVPSKSSYTSFHLPLNESGPHSGAASAS